MVCPTRPDGDLPGSVKQSRFRFNLGGRQARYLQFREICLAAWDLAMSDIEGGTQPIALCEAAMLPLALMAMPELFR